MIYCLGERIRTIWMLFVCWGFYKKSLFFLRIIDSLTHFMCQWHILCKYATVMRVVILTMRWCNSQTKRALKEASFPPEPFWLVVMATGVLICPYCCVLLLNVLHSALASVCKGRLRKVTCSLFCWATMRGWIENVHNYFFSSVSCYDLICIYETWCYICLLTRVLVCVSCHTDYERGIQGSMKFYKFTIRIQFQ